LVVFFFATTYILLRYRIINKSGGIRMRRDTMVQQQESHKTTSLEEVWALFRESERRMQETDRQMQETDRRMQETDRQMQETGRRMQETDRMIKELTEKTDRQIGRLGSRLGEVIEHLMSPKLQEKFETLGYRFNHSSRNHELEDSKKNRLTEVDVLLENGDYAMAVEVKTHLTTEDVQDHAKRMEILRRVADDHGDRRKYLGAVAGAVIDREVTAYALKTGFYVIVPSGDTVKVEAPEGFKPRLW
jgi:hypothetical protein